MQIELKLNYILDANINRFKEGARVLEDISRFVLADKNLFLKIKKIKHKLKLTTISRKSSDDIGGPDYKESNHRNSLLDLVNANAIRMQESARVLEEVTQNDFYKSLRFSAYTLHGEIEEKVKLYLRKNLLSGLYPIYDPDVHKIEEFIKYIDKITPNILQIRIKNRNKLDILKIVKEIKYKTKNKNCLLILNDYIDIALSLKLDGVHLGQSDLPLEYAKKITPENFIIGITCHNIEHAKHAEKLGASYIGVGSIYPTNTKKDAKKISFEDLEKINNNTSIPVCAIGGINSNNIYDIKNKNIAMIAICSSLAEFVLESS